MRVYWNTILISSHGIFASWEQVTQRNQKTYFRSKLSLNTQKIIFLPSALKMLFKETFRDPNVAVSPKKHLFSTWSCKPPELNIQRFEQVFWSESSNKRETNILALLRFKIPFTIQRDAFGFNPFGTFGGTTFRQVRNSSPGTLWSCRGITRL